MKNKDRIINRVLAFTCSLFQVFLLLSISSVAYSTDNADSSSDAVTLSDSSINTAETFNSSEGITSPGLKYTIINT